MLASLRTASATWSFRIFLGLLLLCFVLLWQTPGVKHSTKSDLFTSGKSTFTYDDYIVALDQQIVQTSKNYHLGGKMSLEDVKRFNLPFFVSNQALKNVTLDEETRLLKLGISQDKIAEFIRKQPDYLFNGTFYTALFLRYAQDLGVPTQTLVDYYSNAQKRHQILDALASGIITPKIFTTAFNRYQNEVREVRYFTFTPKILFPLVPPADAALQAWYKAHPNEFKVPEYRTVSLMELKKSDVFKPKEIPAKDVESYYNKNKEKFAITEKRDFDIVHFAHREQAEKILKTLGNNLTEDAFIKAVTTADKSLKIEHKTGVTKGSPSDKINAALFALKQNTYSKIIDDNKKSALLYLKKITPKTFKALKDVENNIRSQLAEKLAYTKMHSLYTEMESTFTGNNIEALAQKYKLPLHEITIDPKGKDQKGTQVKDIPEKELLLQRVFQGKVGAKHNAISSSQNGYVLYQIKKIIPAYNPSFAAVKPRIIARWKKEETQRLLDKQADQIKQKFRSGIPFEQIANEFNLPIQRANALTRTTSSGPFDLAAIDQIFSKGKNEYDVLISGQDNEARIVYQITAIKDGKPRNLAPNLVKKVNQQFDQVLQNDYEQAFIELVGQQHPIKINVDLYHKILQDLDK